MTDLFPVIVQYGYLILFAFTLVLGAVVSCMIL